LQKIVNSFRAEEPPHKLLRGITRIHICFATVEHGWSKEGMGNAEMTRFLKYDGADQLLSVRRKALQIAQTNDEQSACGDRA
jgi:hypothetical protein